MCGSADLCLSMLFNSMRAGKSNEKSFRPKFSHRFLDIPNDAVPPGKVCECCGKNKMLASCEAAFFTPVLLAYVKRHAS